MAARRQPDQEDTPVNRYGRADEEAIQRYLELTDDGEIARLAAMMTPQGKVFNAHALVTQAAALQAEAAAELVRRREVMVASMSLATLSELARHLGVRELNFLSVIHEDSLPDHPIQGPVLRRIASMMREMPPPQEFADLFLAENPTNAMSRASSRTSLPRPLPIDTFEEVLRYAANIPEDVVSWEILNGAFLDFLRLWFHNRLGMAELLAGGSDPGRKMTTDSSVLDRIEGLRQERIRFHENFKPGHKFPPDITELAHRAYTECWESGILGPLWRQRLGWLADEFTPFWQRFGGAYCALEADAKTTLKRTQQERSTQKSKAGEIGRQRREAARWRSVTGDFIEFLKANSTDSAQADLQDCVASFVESSSSLGGNQKRANTREFFQVLCVAVSAEMDARAAFDTLQRSRLAKISALEPEVRKHRVTEPMPNQMKQYRAKGTTPSDLVQFKSLTEEAVRDCLDDLKHALSKACGKKSKK